MMSRTRPTNESPVERRIARQRECIAQVQTHIEGLLSSSPDVRGAKLLQAEMIRELARLRACRSSRTNSVFLQSPSGNRGSLALSGLSRARPPQ
jgi:hypothetical protein